MDTAASKLQLWTLQERLTVLHALVLCYLSTPKLTNHIQFLQDQMERLKTIAGHTSFKEGEFLKIVNELIGDHETSQCQQMLDEIAGDNNRTPRALASRIFEGRCTQCKGSTFPEDNVDSDHEGAEGKPKPRGRGKGKKNMKNTEDLNSTGNHSHESKKEKSTHHGSEESQSSQQQTTQSKEEKREQRKKKHEVILCDGCNAESHLRCLGLNNVPAGDYYCKECSLRYQARPTSDDLPVDDLDQYRDNKIEEEFHNRKIDRLAAQEGHTVLTVDTPLSPEIDTNTLECMYCRMSETELCSPMVFSQSRIEHEEHVKASKNAQRAVTHLGVNVTFAVNGKKVLPPPIRAPYFPTITSMESAQLMELQTELQGNTSSNITTITAPVPLSEQPISKFAAHQICALEMYRARASKYKNLLRRKRRRVVSLVLSMAGISVRPLGQDDKNRIYWKFPSSQALFICSTMGSAGEAQKLAFHELVQSQRNQHSTTLATPSVPFVYKMPEWKIITEPTQILALSNALGPSTEEQALRRNLVDTFTRRNGIYKNISAKKNTASIEGIIKNTTAEEQALSATDMQVDSIDLIEEMKTKEHPGNDSMNVVSFKDTRDQTPVELVLLDGKSMSIEQEVVIAEESAFQDQPVNELGEEPDFGSEFMVFGKKFYGVVLLNAAGRKLKLPNGSVTVTCQVHLSGVSRPLASTPLTDAWSDGAYYFSTAVFLRSGEYIISFVVEGTNAVNISPLIYPVTVTSRATKSGPSEALIRLNAWTWLLQADRRILVPRIKRSILQMKIQRSHINEFEYVRAALLAVFAALPMGCLPPIIVEDRKSSNNKKTAAALAAEIEMRGEDITEAAGWTEELEALWYDVVTGATVPLQLMEAVLLLESCITKSKWYSDLGQRLMSTLPAPHAALRCVTLPTVALRIFSLDRALCYDKVMDDPRSRRSGMATETSTRTLNKHVPTAPSAISQAISNPVTALKATQNNTNRGQKRRLESGSGNDDEEAFNRDLAKAMAASVRDANRDKRNTNYTHSDIHGDKRLNQIAAKVNAPHTLLADESTATEESEASEEEEDRMFSTDSED